MTVTVVAVLLPDVVGLEVLQASSNEPAPSVAPAAIAELIRKRRRLSGADFVMSESFIGSVLSTMKNRHAQ